MNKERYKELTSKIVPEENKTKNGIIAFLTGGLIGFLGQVIVTILENNFNVAHKDATTIMIVILIFLASLSTAMGFFDNLVSKARAGLIVPITGFAHAMTSSMIDYKKEGLVTGIGSNAFKLTGSVILYGVLSAYVFGIVRYLFFGG
ncbi:stage V sporulation protein AC [Clostridium sp. CAG:594]|jgi:stage V sporulation protein AC|nr:stage V sporulation protein AC [Clostridium sp. CAG:594]